MKTVSALIAAFILWQAAPAFACTLVYINPEDVRTRMAGAVADELGIAESEVNVYDLTIPRLTFLVPLGADCSGLESAFHSSSFYFTKQHPTMQCTHRGVVLLTGYGLDSDIEVHNYSSCIGNPVVPPDFAGNWVADDENTNYLTRFVISEDEHTVRAWGACSPQDCDWGYVPLGVVDTNTRRAIFSNPGSTRTLTFKFEADGSIRVISVIGRNNGVEQLRSDTFHKQN